MLPCLLWISPGRGLGEPLYQRLATCVRAGLRGFQLREKLSYPGDILAFAERAQQLLAEHEGLLLINDRVDIARAARSGGVHLGSRSLPCAVARSILSPGQLIGASVHDIAELERALEGGADYVFASPVYPVRKEGRMSSPPLGPVGLSDLVRRSSVPVFALGGVDPAKVAAVQDTGVHGIAVLSGIAGARDPAAAVEAYLSAWS